MNSVLLFDIESDGLDPATNRVIEIGYVLWSVKHRTIVECFSSLVYADSNAAEPFNAISPAVLRTLDKKVDAEMAWDLVGLAAEQADAVLAHQADFDRAFAENSRETPSVHALIEKPWICTIEDFVWPRDDLAARSLVAIALAHGVAVTSAHRAINDCLLLARLLERMGDEVEDRLHLALQRAMRPKNEFIARTAYKDKDLVKMHGFHWNGTVWHRRMAVEDAEKLPFEVVSMDKAIEEARA